MDCKTSAEYVLWDGSDILYNNIGGAGKLSSKMEALGLNDLYQIGERSEGIDGLQVD